MKQSAYIFLMIVLAVSLASAVKAQTITTIAGGGPNGIPATSSNVGLPGGVAVDGFGNVFIAANNQVLKTDTGGQLTIYAGTGRVTDVTNGDGGPATQATFDFAEDVGVDSKGNVFVTDPLVPAIRRIDASSHIITTYVDGSAGIAAPHGLTFDSQNNLFIADSIGVVWRVDAKTRAVTVFAGNFNPGNGPSPDGTAAASADIGAPMGIAIDSHGNLFTSDNVNGNLYRFDSSPNHSMKTVMTGLTSPVQEGIATDKSGNVYVADFTAAVVKRWDASSQTVNTGVVVAGTGADGFSGDGGPAAQAQISTPTAVSVRGNSTLYIADFGNSRIRAVDLRSRQDTITTLAGNGTIGFGGDGFFATQASLFNPQAVLSDGFGNLYIADTANNAVRRVDAFSNVITTYAGTPLLPPTGDIHDGGPATAAALSLPGGLGADLFGNLYIADTGNERIRAVDPIFHRINTVAGDGNFGNSCDPGAATSTSLAFPMGVVSDLFGNLFIADQFDNCVRRVDVFSHQISDYADDPNSPAAIARDSAGNLYLADTFTNIVQRVDAHSHAVTVIAGTPSLGGYGGDGGPATAALLNLPTGVAVDGFGNVYIADSGNNVIRKVDTHGNISTVAGQPLSDPGFSGDGGPATSAQLALPSGVAIDNNGNLLIADTGNNRIRRVTLRH